MKIILGIFGFLLLLLVAVIVIAPLVFDPNDYKEEIATLVKDKTGRDLKISEPIKLSLFPWIGLQLGGVSLSNAAGFSDKPFASIEDLDFKVAFKPLLSKRVVIDTVVLNGMHLNLEKDAQGKTNWDDLAKLSKAEKAQEEGEAAAEKMDMELQVHGVDINDTQISWSDKQSGETYLLTDFDLSTGALGLAQPVPINSSFKVSMGKQDLRLAIELGGEMDASKDFQNIVIQGFAIAVSAKGGQLPEQGASVKLGADLGLNLQKETFEMEDLSISSDGLDLTGKASVSGFSSGLQASGQIELQKTDLTQLMKQWGVQYKTTDPQVLKHLSATLSWKYKGDGIYLNPLTFQLDDTHLKGHINLPEFSGPTVRLQLDVDSIDIDRYLPPAVEGEVVKEAAAPAAAPTSNPFTALRTLNLEGKLSIGQLIVSKARMQNIKITINSKNGLLSIDPLQAELYEGTVKSIIKLNAKGKTPKFNVSEELKGIQIGPLLKDVTGKDTLLGTGNVSVDLQTAGLTDAEYKKNLNGTMSLSLKDGAYKGINIADSVRKASALGGGQPAASNESVQTDFSELTASAVIRNGVLKNDDLKVASPLLRIDGKGTVDMNKEHVNYLLTTELVGTLEGQGGKSATDLTGVAIPVRLKGNWAAPKVSVDMEAALKANAGKKIEEQKEKLKEKAEEKIKEKLGDSLKGLFR